MNGTTLALGVGLLALVGGCHSTVDPPVDPEQAGAALQTALAAWKQGEDPAELRERHPPITFNEPEWQAGKALVAFAPGNVELLGRQGRCSVKLTLRDKSGKTTERTIRY